MTGSNGTIEPSKKDVASASIDLKIPPDEFLAGSLVTDFLQAGYDISVTRVYSDTFDPPKLDHYILSLISDIDIETEKEE